MLIEAIACHHMACLVYRVLLAGKSISCAAYHYFLWTK